MYIILFDVYCRTDCFLFIKSIFVTPFLGALSWLGTGVVVRGGPFAPGIPPGQGCKDGAEAFARAVAVSGGGGQLPVPFLPVPFLPAPGRRPFRRCALRSPGGAAAGRRAGRAARDSFPPRLSSSRALRRGMAAAV